MHAATPQNETLHKWLYFFISLAVLINFSGLFVPLMDPDAGVYASISRNMLWRNDYINLWFHDADWLDKPHFPFWITALFFKIFGTHDWAYKLPGILFSLLGAGYTYLFTKQYYNKTIALWAAFVLLTAMHFIISNNDVRAEPFITGLIIASVYHFSNSLSKNLSWHLVIACFFAACCVMTKGIFTLIPIGGAIAGELIIRQNWKQIFHWRWLVALVLVVIFIFPELYSLWYQFDSHPEKIVFEKTNVSGIRFFLWDSQFGRFLNTGPIKGKGDPTFFIHTLVWATLFIKIKNGVKKTKAVFNEWYSLSGSLLTLLVFSFSKFQLPHYSNIIFPFLAILSASFISHLIQTNNKTFKIIQTTIGIILIVCSAALAIIYKPQNFSFFKVVFFAVFMLLFLFLPALFKTGKPVIPYLRSGLAALIVALFLNLILYPDLLKYQSGNQAAFFVNKNYPNTPIARLLIYTPAGEFYLDRPLIATTIDSLNKRAYTGLLLITQEEFKELENSEARFEILKEFEHFHITRLQLKFINANTRQQLLEKRYLVNVF
jgi:4-amino-4-deoxy-L-arabinose transferase-like glycosyltransferase